VGIAALDPPYSDRAWMGQSVGGGDSTARGLGCCCAG
jgi:hypothetical protein